jgi:hypothetical protein
MVDMILTLAQAVGPSRLNYPPSELFARPLSTLVRNLLPGDISFRQPEAVEIEPKFNSRFSGVFLHDHARKLARFALSMEKSF